ncbi:MAG: hypothetical protein OK455_08160, partial [Thaumarchaeota archaeon]|nr:hypothetical protein [Nitrososphaerota archaeon]
TLNQTTVIFAWNGYDYVCSDSPSQGLATFAVFKGHYSKGNISSAGAPLKEGPPFIPPCPSLGLFSGGPITFLPNGDQTTIQYFTYDFSLHQHEYAYLKAGLNAWVLRPEPSSRERIELRSRRWTGGILEHHYF